MFLLAFVAVLLGQPMQAAAQAMYLRVGDGSLIEIAPGETFTLPIRIDQPQDLAALTIQLTWDPAAFIYQATNPGSFGQVTVNDALAPDGTLYLSLFSPTGTSNSFDLANIEFVSALGGGFFPDVLTAGNTAGEDITPSVIPVDKNLCVGVLGLRGDANGDGSVNIIDAQQIARSSVGQSVADPQRVARLGDATEDTSVDIIDAQQIARFSVFLPSAPGIAGEVGGCWEEILCTFTAHPYAEIVVGESQIWRGGPLQWGLYTIGNSVEAAIRSPVPWFTPSVSGGTTPFGVTGQLYGEPSAPRFSVLPLVPTTSQAKVVPCQGPGIAILHPTIQVSPDSIAFLAVAGDPSVGTEVANVWVQSATAYGLDHGIVHTVDFLGGSSGWLSVQFVPPTSEITSIGHLTLTTSAAGLSVGVYRAEITLLSPKYAGIPPKIVPVVFEVVAPS